MRNIGVLRQRRGLLAGAAAVGVAAASAVALAGPAPLMRHVSRDTTTTPGFQHETVAEPSIAAGPHGRLVAVYQVGRSVRRGAAAIGFATSLDGGRTWRNGLFESVSRANVTPSTPVDVTDAVVTYDRVHRVWLVASVADFANGSRTLQLHRSADGLRWSKPAEVARGVIDHEWLACDGSSRSAWRGRCYVAFTREDAGRLGVRSSVDGGSKWSGETAIPSTLGHPGAAYPVVRPDGTLVVVFREGGFAQPGGRRPPFVYSAVRSSDGGRTFGSASRVGPVQPYFHPLFRDVPALVPSVAVDARGRLYAAWHSCRFRRPCAGNDLVIAQSATGARWSRPRRVPLDRRTDHVLPGLAVAPAPVGRPVRLGLAYYTIASDRCRRARCTIAPYFVSSENGGRTWSRPLRLHRTIRFTWVAQSPAGRTFVADNVSTTFVGSAAWTALVVANPPSGGKLHQRVAVARVRRAELRW